MNELSDIKVNWTFELWASSTRILLSCSNVSREIKLSGCKGSQTSSICVHWKCIVQYKD